MKKAVVVTLVFLSVFSVCSLTGCGGTMLINDAKPVNPANSGCGTADFANEAKKQAQVQGTDSSDESTTKDSKVEEGTKDPNVDSIGATIQSADKGDPDVDSTGVTIQSQSADSSEAGSSDQISTLPLEDGQKAVVD